MRRGPALYREDQAVDVARALAQPGMLLLFALFLREHRPTSEPVPLPTLPLTTEAVPAPVPPPASSTTTAPISQTP